MKALIASTVIALSALLSPASSHEIPDWSLYWAKRACFYMNEGVAYRTAGNKATEDMLKIPAYKKEFAKLVQRGQNLTIYKAYTTSILEVCGAELMRRDQEFNQSVNKN